MNTQAYTCVDREYIETCVVRHREERVGEVGGQTKEKAGEDPYRDREMYIFITFAD